MIIYCASDAGPAKYLIYLINKITLPSIVFDSSISRVVFRKHAIPSIPFNPDIINEDVKCAILGTTLNESAEKEIISLSKKFGFPTISVVEHWTNYIERFRSFNKLNFPDYIIVNDEYAASRAAEEGIPKEIIIALGNPVLEDKIFMTKVNESDSKSNKILFISEQLHINMPSSDERFLGFNQFDVLDDIFNSLNEDTTIHIKLHPSESESDYRHYIKNYDIKFISEIEMHQNLSDYSIIIGMESMLLIELACNGIKTFSYRPNSNRKFIGCEMNWVIDIKKDDLAYILSEPDFIKEYQIDIPKFNGSLNRISNWVKEIYENNSIYTG